MGFFDKKEEKAPKPVILETPWGPENRGVITDARDKEFGGMNQTEKAGQANLNRIMAGKAFQDPNTSQYYQGLRSAMMKEEEQNIAQLRHRQQMTGMGNSSHAMRGEATVRTNASNNRMSLLGSLYDRNQARDNDYTRMDAMYKYGGLNRQIAGQRVNIAQGMLAYDPWYRQETLSNQSQFRNVFNSTNQGMQAGSKAGPYGAIGGGVAGGVGGALER